MLPLATRFQIATLLAVPGGLTALLPGDFDALALPLATDGLAVLRAAIVDGIGPGTLTALAGSRLRDVIPALVNAPGGPAAGHCSVRLLAALERDGASTWAVLGERTLAEISELTNVGPKALVALLECALAAVIQCGGDTSGRATTPSNDLAALLAYERESGSTTLRDALAQLAKGQNPSAIRAAAARLTASRGDKGNSPADRVVSVLDRALAATGDARDRVVFERLVLQLGGAPTGASVTRVLDVGNQRVRQLRDRATERMRAAMAASGEDGLLRAVVDCVKEGLGVAAPVAAADLLLESLELPSTTDTRSLLLLWWAGPYRPVTEHPGWIAVHPTELVLETARVLSEDDGVRLASQVRKDFQSLCLVGDHVDAWLAQQPVRVVDDLVVLMAGSPVDVAARALSAAGQAMTTQELREWTAAPPSRAATATNISPRDDKAALRRDARFVRIGPDDWELAEWGAVPYEDAFNFAGPGGVRSLCIEVDHATLAGSGGAVPQALVESLSMVDGGRRTFATRYGPLALSYDGLLATRGSVRPIALAVGALAGDTLVVSFRPDIDGATVELLPLNAATLF